MNDLAFLSLLHHTTHIIDKVDYNRKKLEEKMTEKNQERLSNRCRLHYGAGKF
jgi:hypothetical protein